MCGRWRCTSLDCILGEGVFAHLIFVLIRKEVHDLGTMIALKLDHLSHVGILDDGTIAS